MSAIKNIMMIIPNLDYGGAQQAFVWLSNELARRYQVVNVVFNTRNMAPYVFRAELINLDISASGNWIIKILNFFRRVRKIRQLKKKYNIHVSISFLEGADYVNILSQAHDITIISVRGSKYHDQNINGITGYIRHKFLLPWVFNKANAITTVSSGLVAELQNLYRVKRPVYPVYNAILSDIIQRAKAEKLPARWERLFEQNQGKIIISHGRLSAEKGYKEFINVLAQLFRSGVNFRCIILGDGTDRQDLIKLTEQSGMMAWAGEVRDEPSDNALVFFAGYRPNPFPFLLRASVYALPSKHEGMSNSLLEALACGLPVVASDCPYAPGEVLTQGNVTSDELVKWADYGVLVPSWQNPDATAAWKNALTRLLADEGLRNHYAKRAVERCRDFSAEGVAGNWIAVIEKSFPEYR